MWINNKRFSFVMRVVRHYKNTAVKEADEIQNGSGTGTSNELKSPNPQNQQRSINIKTQIVELVNQRLQRKTQYQQDIKNIESRIVSLQKQLADLDEDIDPSIIEESFKSKSFSKKLFESVTNRTDEMYVMLRTSFDQIEDLSYTPEDVRLQRFAKTIIGYINKSSFQNENNKADDFEDFVMAMINNSHVSLTKKEIQTFIDNFTNNLKENTMFSWIFA